MSQDPKGTLQDNIERFELIKQATSECICDLDPKTDEIYLNEGFNRIFGWEAGSKEENAQYFLDQIHPDDKDAVRSRFVAALEDPGVDSRADEYRIRKADGSYAYILDKALIKRDEQGSAYRVIGVIRDITRERFYRELERIEKEVIELSLKHEVGLNQVLDDYMLRLEGLLPGMKATVMGIRDQRLQKLSAPSMPEEYIHRISGLSIGPKAGSCGTAAYLKQQVIVEDVFKDDKWEQYLDLAETFGFAACWSVPVMDAEGEVIATFANYYQHPHHPGEMELQAIDRSQHILSMLLANAWYVASIRESNERFHLVNQATNDAIYDWDVVNDTLFWGDGFQRIFGHDTHQKAFRLKNWSQLVHPTEIDKVQAGLDAFLANQKQTHWHSEYRFERADGSYAWVEETAYVIRTKGGMPIRMIGVLRDVSVVKLTETQEEIAHEVSAYFKERKTLQDTLDQVLAYLADIGQFEIAELWLVGRKGTLLHRRNTFGAGSAGAVFHQKSSEVVRLEKGEGLPGTVWQSKKLEVWNDIDKNKHFVRDEAAKSSGVIAAAGIPLVHHQEFTGVLVLGATQKDLISPETLEPFLGLTSFLGAEIVRKQQEEEMQLLFEYAPEMLSIFDPSGYFLKVNPAFTAITGYSAEELTTRHYDSFVHEEDHLSAEKEAEAIQEGKGQYQIHDFVNRWKTKDGAHKWISWNTSPAFNEEGQGFAFGRDITAYRELQELLNTASRLARVGGWELHVKSKEVYWSDMTYEIHEAEKTFKPSLEDGINFYREDVRQFVVETVEQSIKNHESWDFELPIITAKGNERWIRSIGTPYYVDNEFVKLVGSFQDIHDRKTAEMRLQHTADNLPGAIFQYWLHPDGTDHIRNLTRGAVDLWGHGPEAFMQDINLIWEQTKGGGDFERVKRSIMESAETLQPWHCQYRSRLPNGRVLWHEGYGKPQRMADGTIVWDSLIIDITEKKEVEHLLEQASNLARIGSWELNLTDHRKDEMYWSPMTREIMEVSDDYNPSLTGGFEFYESESKSRIQKAVKTLIDTGKEFDEELLITTAKGRRRWIRSIGESNRVDGQCVRIFGCYQDIHESKTNELALQRAFQEKTNILESIGDAFFTVDRQFVVTYWNKQAEAVTGKLRINLIGRVFWEAFPKMKGTLFQKEYEAALRDEEVKVFEEYYSPLNKWVEVAVYPSADGLSVYFKDVTMRKVTEDRLKESNERFEKVTQATNDAIWDWDIANNSIFRGGGFKKLFGYEPELMSSSRTYWEEYIHPDDLHRVKHSIENVLNDDHASNWTKEYRYLKKDGAYAYVVDRGIVIRDDSGKAIRMVGAMTDITYQKEYEQSLKELNSQLRKYAHDLEISNTELEQFAFVASHDLQEPLRMVSGFLSRLETKYGDLLDARAHEYIRFATDGAQRMRQFILDLLEFSRVGKHNESLENIKLNHVVDEVKIILKREIEQSKARLHVDDLPEVVAYTTPLIQIFQNLISNAIKYTDADVPPQITIKSQKKGDEWVISIKDNGLGIEKEYFDKIFVIFQRLHGKDEYSGTGMGLAVVKKNVELLGGQVWLESTPGAGSTFSFTLPVGKQDEHS